MSNIKTNCKNCTFAKVEDGVQTGCTMNRHLKLGIDGTTEENNFQLSRFCNTYRPSEWLQTLSFEEQLEPESVALKEVCPRLGFFVKFEAGLEFSLQDLDVTLRSISKLSEKASFVVVINDKVEYNEEIWGLFISHFGETSETKYHLLQTEFMSRPNSHLDAAFSHAQNGWVMYVNSGTEVDSDTVNKLDRVINLDMRQIVLVEPVDGFNKMMFPAYLFKFLNGNRTKIFDDKVTDSSSFIEKVRAADKRSEGSSIMTWEEFNAS